MLVLLEGGNLENPEKNPRSKTRTNNKLNPLIAPGRNRTRATMMGGQRSHQCAIPAPQGLMNCREMGVSLSYLPVRVLWLLRQNHVSHLKTPNTILLSLSCCIPQRLRPLFLSDLGSCASLGSCSSGLTKIKSSGGVKKAS